MSSYPYVKLNAEDPAPPANTAPVHFRADYTHAGTSVDPVPISGYTGVATTGATGVVKPDGTTISVDSDGTIHSIGGGGGGIINFDGGSSAAGASSYPLQLDIGSAS